MNRQDTRCVENFHEKIKFFEFECFLPLFMKKTFYINFLFKFFFLYYCAVYCESVVNGFLLYSRENIRQSKIESRGVEVE
jgi:hypothetical protein